MENKFTNDKLRLSRKDKRGGRIMNEKKSLIDKMTSKIDVIAGPMTKFGQKPFVAALTDGMVSSVGITIIGSLFMVVWLFCADGNITKHALLPFMKPYANDLLLVNQLTMGIMALYMVTAMGAAYADRKGIDKTSGTLASLLAFILLNYNSIGQLANVATDGTVTAGVSALPINYWGGAGIITAILATAISINIMSFCYKRNIRIKMPESVPPAISNTFSAIIPYFITTLICWGVRTLLSIDIPTLIGEMLLPVFSAADNVFVFTFAHFLKSVLWACGLHGDNIVDAVTNAFTNTWIIANNEAVTAHQVAQYIWTPNLQRIFMWTSSCWPILIYMFKSSKKLPQLKPLAAISAPAAIFSIVEPLMFGLPIVLNPFLMIPFILSHTITGALTYLATQIGFMGKMYIALPWATPAPLLGYLSTGGSIGGIILVIINFLIGMVIFYPFWKAYEKSEVEKLQQEQLEQI